MGTYSQWKVHADRGVVKRVTWVCGPERLLVEEVVDVTRRTLNASDMDYVSLDAGSTPDKDIWAAASQYPLVPGANRLILIRDAEKIKKWSKLGEWMDASAGRILPTVYLLFVSNETDYPYVDPKAERKVMKQHVAWIKDRDLGQIVRCTLPHTCVFGCDRKGPHSDDLLAWIRSHSSLDDHLAKRLLVRVGGNLWAARNVCRKLALFGDRQFGADVIDALCEEAPYDSIADALVRNKKRQAFQVLDSLNADDFNTLIGLLNSRLDLLSTLHKQVRQFKNLREIVSSTGLSDFLVKQFIDVAKNYDPDRVSYCRRVLATVDDALHGSTRDGVMIGDRNSRDGYIEALIALW